MIDLLKKALLLGVVIVVGYYSMRFIAGYSLAKQVAACATEVNSGGRLQAAKTDEERRAIKLSVVDCTAKRISFPGSLMFDEHKLRASMQ